LARNAERRLRGGNGRFEHVAQQLAWFE